MPQPPPTAASRLDSPSPAAGRIDVINRRLRVRVRLRRAAPLAVQLLLTFVALVAGTTAVLTIAAYRTSLGNLEADARRRVKVAAESREQMLTQILTLRKQRASGFLDSAQQLCAEPAGSHRFGWSEQCLGIVVKEFLFSEHATGALMTYRGRTLAKAGVAVEPLMPAPGALARVVHRPDGQTDLLLRAVRGEAILTIQFDTTDIVALFADRSDLGKTGEIFLTDPEGQFLTQARYAPEGQQPVGANVAEPLAECRERDGDRKDLDYRGVETIHYFRSVQSIGGGCVDAHIAYDEALEPADKLQNDLILRSVEFTVLGAVVSLLLAQRIAAPVGRLVASARALQAGAFETSVPVGGPREVRRLGRALSAMAADLAQLVRQEQAARRQAETANRSKDQFLAMLSHELRTPLNAVLGWARLLQNEPDDPSRVSRAATAIERSALAQQRLIEDLLDVSRIVSGKLRLVRGTVNFSAVTEAALDSVRPQAREKGVNLECTIDDPSILVLADSQRLQQVVWNLAWNAVKFTGSGGVVRVRLRRIDTSAELTVEDTGIGITPDVLPHVFDWFRQGSDGTSAPDAGLGLGLGLVKQLVELHGGRVSARSAGSDQGATFVVTMPTTQGEAVPSETVRSVQKPQSLAGVRALCVDDDLESREVVRAVLHGAGADVQTADTAAAAREQLERFKPDVLVVDIMMPHEDGYDLMQSLRVEGVDTPAVALTAFARREDAERARAAGYQVHMTKPADAERLVSTVAALAGRRAG
jgi:signal transduction histidine kinase/ActR/RegA family two-component response regulator